jgi:tetratricopeptide (TPR) repeat protein
MVSPKPKSSAVAGSKSPVVVICLAIAVVTAAIYWQTSRNGFINFDDPDYIKSNPMTQAGLTLQTVQWAFTTFQASNWHPLTWLSHALDCQLFGLNLGAHHLVSLGFHIANAVLLFLLLRRMTGYLWRSAFVAALFAVHPLHVESVAWIAERKDVLSLLFFLLTLWSYTTYTGRAAESDDAVLSKRRRGLAYVLALVWLALGLLSKPMLVTTPCVLLLVDFWPLRRLDRPAAFGKLLMEKLPFFALAAASSAITFLVQRAGGAVVPLASTSFETRMANAVVAYGQYLTKTVYPVDLAVFYPYVPVDFTSGTTLLTGLLFLAISVGAVVYARTRPWAFVGWFWFVGTLVPVIGLVQVGRQAMADRYTYLPHIGLFILVAWAGADWLGRWRAPRAIPAALATVILLSCAYLTERQVLLWRDSTTLFSHAAKVTANNFIAHGVLANALLDEGKSDEAMEEVELSLRINPGYPEAHATKGHIYAKRKDYEQAVACYREALRLDASYGDAYTSLADALIKQNKAVEAENAAREALRLSPLSLPAHYTLATALHQQQKFPEAVEVYRKLIALDPGLFSPHRYLANAYFAMGKREEAVASFKRALDLKPADQETRMALSLALLESGRPDEAMIALQEVLRVNPSHAMANYQTALIQQSRKEYGAAAESFRKALETQPEWVEALNNLAWLLAACPRPEFRDGRQAVQLAEQAVKLTEEKQPLFLGTLAAALAEAGRYEEAARMGERARALAESLGNHELAKRNGELVEIYRAGKAYHEPE